MKRACLAQSCNYATMQACVLVFWNDDRTTRITNQVEIIVLLYFVLVYFDLVYFVLVYFVCLIKHVFLIQYKETVSKNVDIVMKIDTFLREDRVQNQIYDYGYLSKQYREYRSQGWIYEL